MEYEKNITKGYIDDLKGDIADNRSTDINNVTDRNYLYERKLFAKENIKNLFFKNNREFKLLHFENQKYFKKLDKRFSFLENIIEEDISSVSKNIAI
ncbi:MAG: hypothetical protein U9Q66_03675 [Patescibacteria group bacterium]|nr:hypothetical protein [Patescibacteria group bacterium]